MNEELNLGSLEVKAAIWEKTTGVCWYCGITPNPYKKHFCMDHVVPLSMGGTTTMDNLVPCCRSCNSRKSDRTLERFRFLMARWSDNMVTFSDDQMAYLKSMGIDLPEPPTFIFYFENQGFANASDYQFLSHEDNQ